MTAGGQTPTWEELIDDAITARLEDVNVALPGRVESYDSATQLADVKIMVKRVIEDEADPEKLVEEELPVIPSVLVTALRAGPFFIHMPVKAGQTGQLLFNSKAIDQFRALGEDVAPGDLRLHGFESAVFIPTGLCKAADALVGLNADDMVIGEDGGVQLVFPPGAPAEVTGGGATSFASRDDLIQVELDKIATAIGGVGGTYVPAATAATKLKVE